MKSILSPAANSTKPRIVLLLLFLVLSAYVNAQSCLMSSFTLGSVTVQYPPIFSWYDNCPSCSNYELQILRLYNVDTSKHTATDIKAKIDWSEALVHHINGIATSTIPYICNYLTLTEGTGYYAWRVRRINTRDFVDRTDMYSWSDWAGWSVYGSQYALRDDTLLEVNSTVDAAHNDIFFYTQFNDTMNWIHKRTFGNSPHWIFYGSELNEKIDYANYLLMPVQHQEQIYTYWDTSGRYPLISQTVNDFSGRPVMQTLPAPGTNDWIGYDHDFLKNNSTLPYTPSDFDDSTTYNNPSDAKGTVSTYYSSSNSDKRIPSAEARPMGRTLYYNDPLNRPREISSPGTEHQPDSTHKTNNSIAHTIRKYYAKPTTDELIYMFGDEAPRSESVEKTYTVDPNGTVNITYTDEFDRVIATCLTPPNSTSGALYGYDGYQDSSTYDHDPRPFVNDTVENRFTISSKCIVSKATYSFAVPTQLSYLYKLAARRYGNTCLNICATCDYRLTITAKERNDTATYRYSDELAPVFDTSSSNCSSTDIEKTGTYNISGTALDPGTYDVCVYLEIGNNTLATNKPYLDSVLEVMHYKLDAMMAANGGYVLPVVSGADPVFIDSMQYFANNNDYVGLMNYVKADTSNQTFQVRFNGYCDVITLPTVKCKKPDCDTPKFAQYMKDQMVLYDIKHNTSFYGNVYGGTNGIAATTDTANLFLLGSDSEFDSIINRMKIDGYDCDILWGAWVKTVQTYLDAQRNIVPTSPVLVDSLPKYDWWQDFMNIVGYRFPFKARNYSELFVPTDSVRLKPYKFFPYDWGTDTTAENTFCFMKYFASPCPSPSWKDSIRNFPTYDPKVETFHMYNFYTAVKNNGKNNSYYTNTAIINNAINPANKNMAQSLAKLQLECVKSCDGRLTDLVMAAGTDFMDRWQIKVEGFAYDAWRQPALDSVPITQPFCIAKSVVEQCKAKCNTDPDSSGYLSAAKRQEIREAMLYGIDLYTKSVFAEDACPDSFSEVTIIPSSSRMALLTWLNYLNHKKLDSLANAGVTSFNWSVFTNLYSLGVSPVNIPPCSGSTVSFSSADINDPAHLNYFTYGSELFHGNPTCAGNDIRYYRMTYDSVYKDQQVLVRLYAGLGTALTANDSIIVEEKIPSGFTYVAGDGVYNSGTGIMRYVIAGPKLANDSIEISYYIKSSTTNGTAYFYGGAYIYSSGSATDSCRIDSMAITTASCITLNYVKVSGTVWEPVYTPMCTGICDIVDNCDGNACIRWLAPNIDVPDTTLQERSCGELVCTNFLMALSKELADLHAKYENDIRKKYQDSCLDPRKIKDLYVNKYYQLLGQFTLYFYDRAGNLVRTVAPNGANEVYTRTRLTKPSHTYRNEYDYDTRGHVLRQKTTDGGQTYFYYDKRGRLRFAKNAIQGSGVYSYIKYDKLDRIIETGEISQSGYSVTEAIANDPDEPGSGVTRSFINKMVYHEAYDVSAPGTVLIAGSGPLAAGAYQENITNRLSYTLADKDGDLTTTGDESITIYSYDPHGNINRQYQWISGIDKPRLIEYGNDVFSGKLDEVDLLNTDGTPDLKDAYGLFYFYSQNGRLTEVFQFFNDGTNPLWRTYLHPNTTEYRTVGGTYYYDRHNFNQVRRLELGVIQQGLDYTYTLEGWLKAINYPDSTQDPGYDMKGNILGADGVTNTAMRKDLFSMVLNYYTKDFIHTGSPFHSPGNSAYLQGNGNLFNGNIASWQSKILNAGAGGYLEGEETGYRYMYDQLNRLREANFYVNDRSTGWQYANPGEYDETFHYDFNGNINWLKRYAFSLDSGYVLAIDKETSFTYHGVTNKLDRYADVAGTLGNKGTGDARNVDFTYNAIGNLLSHHSDDGTEDIAVTWTPNNKVDAITDNATSPYTTTTYLYDAIGNRVKKSVSGPSGTENTYYINMADGKTLATYTELLDPGNAQLKYAVDERHIWGLDHLGLLRGENPVHSPGGAYVDSLPPIEYEIKDHLGNTRVVFTDTTTTALPVPPDMLAYNNYYSYGSLQHDRHWNTASYRFGFNGQERDDNILGVGNLNTAKYWEYDTRLGRRWNLDPVTQYSFSNYSVLGCNPITHVDPQGNDWYKSKDGGLMFNENLHSSGGMKELGLEGTYIGKKVSGQLEGNNAMRFKGDNTGKMHFFAPEVIISYSREFYHRMQPEEAYAMYKTADAFAIGLTMTTVGFVGGAAAIGLTTTTEGMMAMRWLYNASVPSFQKVGKVGALSAGVDVVTQLSTKKVKDFNFVSTGLSLFTPESAIFNGTIGAFINLSYNSVTKKNESIINSYKSGNVYNSIFWNLMGSFGGAYLGKQFTNVPIFPYMNKWGKQAGEIMGGIATGAADEGTKSKNEKDN